jgi:hypothetical protein
MTEFSAVVVFHAESAAIASEFGEDFYHQRIILEPKIKIIKFLFQNGYYARKARVKVGTRKGHSIEQVLNIAYECTNSVTYDWAENEEVEMLSRPGSRSSSVGDIFLLEKSEQYFLCTTNGWAFFTIS